ncbi:MAG: Swt1 family HEPN domain-containing protein [Verrucomicrobiales bacterium]
MNRSPRNDWAHQKPFNGDNTYRALDTMARVLAWSVPRKPTK